MKDITHFETILEQQIAQIPKPNQKVQQKLETLTLYPQPRVYSLPVFDIIKSRVMNNGKFGIQADCDDAFFVGDMSSIIGQHKSFLKSLPRVEPFYGTNYFPCHFHSYDFIKPSSAILIQ